MELCTRNPYVSTPPLGRRSVTKTDHNMLISNVHHDLAELADDFVAFGIGLVKKSAGFSFVGT